ncbi:glycerol-3-phosphate 1-O-acyltransferase PlsB [Neptunomonas sp.]|uniref:glycerol-3-phosphate 1-O-acyltransferase PlsB n=1 Tax=Neptunomonas sp. TaxID=1971898 RepID=UPI0025DDC522|nr:glycerol-3-phosphate 1-O-acyltransferase PlsB [Neptunomonas sp.]
MRGLNRISRFLLRLIIHPTVEGKQHLKPTENTLFVIETARYTHRLLLIEQLRRQGNTLPEQKILCAAHSHQEDLRNRIESQVDKLNFLAPEKDIKIVPISVYHGRMPQRETSYLNLLYAESWSKAGMLGHFMQLLVNGRQTLIQVDPALSLKQLKTESPHQPAGVIAHKAVRVFHHHFYRRRLAIIGPNLSHRSTLFTLILREPAVKDAIKQSALEQNRTVEQIHNDAKVLLKGIAANFSPTTARILASLLNIFWKKIYKNIHIKGIERVQLCAPENQLVYLPCHRSHMDYVMLSSHLYQHGLMIPHIAAGDNLNAPVLGSILKRGGAIFMRRSFRDDPLYAQLFQSYLAIMSNKGHSLEYFIEGGRSRTGRLLPAKTGLLSMTLENHLNTPDKPVALVPVWISYDKLVESKSYQQELLGRKKRKESFLGLLTSLKEFRHQFGDAALSFGEPILLQQAINDMPENLEHLPGSTKQFMTQHISQEVLQRINQSAYANQTAILATLLLANPKRQQSIAELSEQVDELVVLLEMLPNPPVAIAKGSAKKWIKQAYKRRQLSRCEDHIFLSASQAQEMTFYRNQLHHMTLLPGIFLLLAKRYPKPIPQTLPRLVSTLYPYLKAELFLPWDASELKTALKQLRLRMEKRGLITQDANIIRVIETPLSIALMQTAEPILVRYYIVFRLLSVGAAMPITDLVSESQRIATHLHQKFAFNSPEYADEQVLNVFIKTLVQQNVFAEKEGQVSCQIESKALLKRATQILNPHYVGVIEQNLHPR